MNLLLDTCTFLWLCQYPANLSARAVSAIDDCENDLFLSEVSVLEITMKHAAGKLPLPESPRRYIPRKLSFHHITSMSITAEVIFTGGELPYSHRDPFDRLLAAVGLRSGMTLVSPDSPLSDLGASRIW